jgi:hypothetical protein
MQKIFGIVLVCLALYLGYGAYFEFNRYSQSNGLARQLQSELESQGNYAGASYYKDLQRRPFWPKIISLACISFVGLLSGLFLFAQTEPDASGKPRGPEEEARPVQAQQSRHAQPRVWFCEDCNGKFTMSHDSLGSVVECPHCHLWTKLVTVANPFEEQHGRWTHNP